MRGDAIDELRRDLIGRHRAAQEAQANAADAEDEAGQARAEDDGEGLAMVRRAIMVDADELALKLVAEDLLLLHLERRDERPAQVAGFRQRDSHAALEVWAQLVDLGRRDARLEHLLAPRPRRARASSPRAHASAL